MSGERHPGSFRDPSGHMYTEGGRLYRQVNAGYREHYARLRESGLYTALAAEGLMVPFEERRSQADALVLAPERVPFISYPYEWCFSQLQDAALSTLRIQRMALDRGMTLKDASAFNIQFLRGRPALIDSLSFEIYREGEPWTAYRQFCEHFLAPLALMAKAEERLGRSLASFIDGIPLDMAARLLPWSSLLSPGLAAHIHLHARAQQRYADGPRSKPPRLGRRSFWGLIDSLESCVAGLRRPGRATPWSRYYEGTSYAPESEEAKAAAVRELLGAVRPATVWDLGANAGRYSRLASQAGAFVVALDQDPGAVERNYLSCRRDSEAAVLPLVMDLANPSAALGWGGEERESLLQRGPADLALALALVHHLAISRNVPLESVARFLARAARRVIIEFVPKSDPQARRLLSARRDVFPDYGVEGFERAFSSCFAVERRIALPGSERTLYLMRREPA